MTMEYGIHMESNRQLIEIDWMNLLFNQNVNNLPPKKKREKQQQKAQTEHIQNYCRTLNHRLNNNNKCNDCIDERTF